MDTYGLVPGQGFEPRLAGPKPAVLPLDDPGKQVYINRKFKKIQYLHLSFEFAQTKKKI